MQISEHAPRPLDAVRHGWADHEINASKSSGRGEPRELRPGQITADRNAVKSDEHSEMPETGILSLYFLVILKALLSDGNLDFARTILHTEFTF